MSQETWEQLFAPQLPLIGRDEEFARLLTLTQRGPGLITLLGAAGVGKTRLGLELLRAAQWQPRACYCDVSAARDPRDLCDALLRALRLPSATIDGRADPVSAVGQWLSERGPGLILLDNFEHLVSSSADLLARWRAAAPQVCWVVTSRQLLRLPGEEVFSLDTLPVPAEGEPLEGLMNNGAVRFFMACAPGLSLVNEAPKIAALVRRLDGLPLALKLAAGRLEVLPLEELATRLRDPFPVLKEPGVAGRSGALWDSLEDSWALLGPEEQLLLRRLSVLVGSFSLEAAEEIAGAAGSEVSVLDALQLLFRKSLLRKSSLEVGRFGMYESVRAFAAQKLSETGETREVLARRARYFADNAAAWSERAFGAEAARYLSKISAESDNINAALQQSLSETPPDLPTALACMRALSRSNYIAWWLQRGIDLLDATLHAAEASADLPPQSLTHLAWLLERKARNCTDQGQTDEGVRVLKRGLDLAARLGETRLEGILLRRLGNALFMQGERAEAATLNQRSLSLLRASRDTQQEGILRCCMGVQAHMMGQNEEAEGHFLAALPLLESEADARFEGYCYGRLGMIRMAQLRWEEARRFMEQGLRVMSRLGPSEEAGARGELATLSHLEGKLEEAAQGYQQALEVFRRFKIKHYLGYLLYNYGSLMSERRALEDAARALEESHQIFTESRFRRDLALTSLALAGVRLQRDSWEDAARLLASADEEAQRDEVVRGVQAAYRALLALRRLEKTEAPHREVAEVFHEASQQYERLTLYQQDDVMLALRVLSVALEEVRSRGAAWRLASDGSFFQPNGGAVVSLARRKTMARLVGALLAHRLSSPNEPLSLADLADAGWPGNRGKWSSLTNNLHVTLSALRRVGLEAILIRQEGGYLLDPKIPVLVEDISSVA